MSEDKRLASLRKYQKTFKIGTIVATVVFGVVLTILLIWEAVAPHTAPLAIVFIFIIVTMLPYGFAGAYFVTKLIIKSCTKKKNKT